MHKNQKQTIDSFTQINKNFLSYPNSLIFTNIRSLRLNFTSFLTSINNIINNIKCIILVETNITDSENNFYNINGFNSVFVNRKSRGGGIAVYIAEHIAFTNISINSNFCEIIQIDLNIDNKNISLLSIYRPPMKLFHRLS